MIKNIKGITEGAWTAVGEFPRNLKSGKVLSIATNVVCFGAEKTFGMLYLPVDIGMLTNDPIGKIGKKTNDLVNEVFTSFMFILMWNIFASYSEVIAVIMTHIMMITFEQLKITNIESFKFVFKESKYSMFLVVVCLMVLTFTWIVKNPLYTTWIIVNLIVNKNHIQPRIQKRSEQDAFVGSNLSSNIVPRDGYVEQPTIDEILKAKIEEEFEKLNNPEKITRDWVLVEVI